MAEKEFDLRKEFDILEEVVNDDHKERINSLENQENNCSYRKSAQRVD